MDVPDPMGRRGRWYLSLALFSVAACAFMYLVVAQPFHGR